MKMKKYLVMVLAIAISGIFVGCHEEEFSGSLIEQKKVTFEETFIKAFGQPDPNHHWGFKTRATDNAITRSYLPNANIWGSTYGLDVPQVLTQAQKERVIAYFQNNKFITGGGSKDLTEFFVQQVYKGGEQNGKYVNILKTNPALTTEKYQSLSMSTPGYGSDHMDRLYANNDPEDHMGNYNGGNMSWNENVENTNSEIEYLNPRANGQHADQIQYIYDTQATGFGYHCSEPSLQYSDHYVLIDGADIDAWAADKNIGESVSGRAFVGFDFDLLTPDAWYTTTQWKPSDIDNQIKYYTDANGTVHELSNEPYTDAKGNPIYYLVNSPNMISGTWLKDIHNLLDISEYRVNGQFMGKTFNKAKLDNYIAQGYRPMTNYNWAKPEIARDYYYSDWIVSIIPGKHDQTVNPSAPDVMTITGEPGKRYTKTGLEIVESGRVMCEDLAGATGNFDDMDYNDVVYDAIIFREYKYLCTETGALLEDNDFTEGYDRTYANVRLMAAGGTIPVEIVIGENNYNVHNELGGSNNVMINTLPNTPEERASVNGAEVLETEPKPLVDDEGSEKLYGVKLISDIKLNVLYQNVSTELTTKYGGATYMFCVPLGLPWAKERRSFAEVYPYFPDWVKQEQNTTWYNTKNPGEFYKDPEGKDLVGLTEPEIPEPTIEFYDNNGAGSTLQRGTVPANPGTMAYPTSSETVLFNFAAEGSGPGYLCPAVTTQDGQTYEEQSVTLPGISDITVGKIIRIYGVYINNWYISPNFSSTINSDADNGYIDIAVDESNLSKIQNGITIKGQNFTVTYVTVY